MSKIFVVAETFQGAIEPVTLELLAAAAGLGGTVEAVVVGAGLASAAAGLGAYGASTVHLAEAGDLADYRAEVYGPIVADLVAAQGPDVVLFAATSTGRDLASAVAAKLGTGLVQDATSVKLGGAGVQATRPIFGGNALETLESATPAIVTVLPKSYEKAAAGGGSASVSNVPVGAAATKTLIKGFAAEVTSGKLNLGDAEVVVAGGRGVGSGEKFSVIEELAGVLGAAVGASRAVTDAGWRPANEQIGQTGVTVKPKLYVAVGISGAVQHWVGMKDSGYIVAINKDPEAPIMKVADVAIVGDLFQVVPELISQIKAAKAAAV